MNWKSIRVYNNSQNSAFEEVVCQLARNEEIKAGEKFVKVGAPDSGVECYWKLDNGNEIVWQAKYVFDIEGTLKEASGSFTTALNGHPQIVEFVLAIPFDLPDPSYIRKGNAIKSALKKWQDKVAAWEKEALVKQIKIKITLWDSSSLLQRLCKTENEGLQYFWFHGEEYTQAWFNNNLENAIMDLGPRYCPELNVELEILNQFDYLRRSEKLYQKIRKYRRKYERICDVFSKKVNADQYNTDELIGKIKEKNKAVLELLCLDGYKEMRELPLLSLVEKMDEISSMANEVMDGVKKQLKDKYYNSMEYNAYIDFENELREGIDWFGTELELLNRPLMLLYGDAGTGKSHLLADIGCKLKQANIPSILLLGEQFVNSVNPREQIKQLLQSNIFFEKMLQIFNSIGQANGERVLFMIDALNEGDGNLIWPKFLGGIINEILKYPWVAFVVSVRTDNQDEIIPQKCNDKLVKIIHHGFEDVVDDACDDFFEYYDIKLEVPVLTEEFSNPLYLKLFCEAYNNKPPMQRIPGVAEVFLEIVNFVNRKLSQTTYYQYDESVNLAQQCIDVISNAMIEEYGYSLSYTKAVKIVNQTVKDFCQLSIPQYKNYLDALIKENIFKSHKIYGTNEKNITFAYERMGEFFLVSHRLKNKDEDISFKEYLEKDEFFKGIFEGQYFRFKNKVMMLSILLPEFYDVELLACAPEGKIPVYIVESFLHSLVWRKNRNISDNIIKWIRQIAAEKAGFKEKLIDNILSMCAIPEASFNIMFIHDNFLINEKCGIRDAWWTLHVNECYEQGTPNIYRRIIRWNWNIKRRRDISKESRKLLGTTLLWFCSSNNREIRDFATKGLVSLYRNNIEEILTLFEVFHDVDDLYVLERLYAGAFGAIVYCDDVIKIKRISDFIISNVFIPEQVIAYLPIRDYAREIVEYAIDKQCYETNDLFKIEELTKPPYRSNCPCRFPSEVSIKKLKNKYAEDMSFSHILSSMDMGPGYGDFGKYIFYKELSRFADVDVNKLNRWVIKRTLQLGFNPKVHDKSLPGYYGRKGGKKERIGKKYQWIAFYEILAYVSDKYLLKSEYDEDSIKYGNEEWYSQFRNIDPSLLVYKSKILNYRQPERSWVSDFEFLPDEINEDQWLAEKPDFIEKLLKFEGAEKQKWLSLCYFPYWNEYREDSSDWKEESKKSMHAYINSYIIHKSDLSKVKALYVKDKQALCDGFDVENYYGLFSRDYYWAEAYRQYAKQCNRQIWNDLQINDKDTEIKYANTAVRHIWEEEYDLSKEDTFSIDIPAELLVKNMELTYKEKPGEYYNNGKVICFNPGMEQESNHLLLIDQEFFETWLKENEFCSIWIIILEKNIKRDRGIYGSWVKWSGLYYSDGNELKGKMELEEKKRSDF